MLDKSLGCVILHWVFPLHFLTFGCFLRLDADWVNYIFESLWKVNVVECSQGCLFITSQPSDYKDVEPFFALIVNAQSEEKLGFLFVVLKLA